MTDKSNVLISVIIATYNAELTLGNTLNSLSYQNYTNFETILVDGCSTDNTIEVAKGYDALIDCLVSEEDRGIADAWNKGISKAKGRWLIFLNSGDLLHPFHFSRVQDRLNSCIDSAIFFCDVLKFTPDGLVETIIKGNYPSIDRIKMGGVGFGHPGSFTAVSLFTKFGVFNDNLRIAIDSDFILRCFKSRTKFFYFDSMAYMSTGGISDIKFSSAMREYASAAFKYKLISHYGALFLIYTLPALRLLIKLLRRGKFILRSIKHIIIGILNIIPDLTPGSFLRKILFILYGFNIKSGASIGYGTSFYTFSNLTIGKNSVINRNCVIDNRGVINIGDNVSISRGVQIYTAGHDPHSPYFEMTLKPVIIEDHCVIFSRSTIMPGVTIGKGAVVYSGSVVTKNVESMSMVAGNPAIKIGNRLSIPRYSLDYSYPYAM